MFEVTGVYTEKGLKKKFKKLVDAKNEKRAIEIVFSLIGSEHKVKRKRISIKEIKKVEEEKK